MPPTLPGAAPPSAAITLNSIKKTTYEKGGWEIDYDTTGIGVARYDIRLLIYRNAGLQVTTNFLNRLPTVPFSGVMDNQRLQYLLWNINGLNLWGSVASACLVLRTWSKSGYSMKYSNPIQFDCPVKPVFGCNFELSADNAAKCGELLENNGIEYSTDAALLSKINVFGTNYLMFHASRKFLTSDDERSLEPGSNCIGFADAALGLDSPHLTKKTGSYIAEKANATLVMEEVDREEVLKYFSDKNKKDWDGESYVLWWDTHVIIVVDGKTYEYLPGFDYHKNDSVVKRIHNIPKAVQEISLAKL